MLWLGRTAYCEAFCVHLVSQLYSFPFSLRDQQCCAQIHASLFFVTMCVFVSVYQGLKQHLLFVSSVCLCLSGGSNGSRNGVILKFFHKVGDVLSVASAADTADDSIKLFTLITI